LAVLGQRKELELVGMMEESSVISRKGIELVYETPEKN
jgi:hypothetical protein